MMDDLKLCGGFLDIWARYDRFVFSGKKSMYVDTTDKPRQRQKPPHFQIRIRLTIRPGLTLTKSGSDSFMPSAGGYQVNGNA
ncbi:hypothetical protein CW304_32135 [Bacillus sp. UFRGS-B20]|nr:hypothetical protein CW304_32135 [Bacillus sp. UFRGS-B20]